MAFIYLFIYLFMYQKGVYENLDQESVKTMRKSYSVLFVDHKERFLVKLPPCSPLYSFAVQMLWNMARIMLGYPDIRYYKFRQNLEFGYGLHKHY